MGKPFAIGGLRRSEIWRHTHKELIHSSVENLSRFSRVSKVGQRDDRNSEDVA